MHVQTDSGHLRSRREQDGQGRSGPHCTFWRLGEKQRNYMHKKGSGLGTNLQFAHANFTLEDLFRIASVHSIPISLHWLHGLLSSHFGQKFTY